MHKRIVRVAAIAFAAALASAAAIGGAFAVSPRDVRNSTWTTETISGQRAVSQPAPTVTFHEAYRISGVGGCNQFFGIYGADDGDVAIRTLQSRQGECAPEVMAQERAFFDALRNAEDMSIGDDRRLTVRGPHRNVIVLRPAP
jgi:heat shock protein HslJ